MVVWGMSQVAPCRYPKCPALKSERSHFGYCAIHHQIATVEHIYNQSKAGRAGAEAKEFALDLEKGLFPSFFKA